MKCAGLPYQDCLNKACGKDVSFYYAELDLCKFCERVRKELNGVLPLTSLSKPYRNKSDGKSTEGSSVGQTESITTCVTSSVTGEQKTKASNSITSSASVPSDKVLIQPVISYIVFSMPSGSVENIKNATVGFFSDEDITAAKDYLWAHCGSAIIGEKKKRKETNTQSAKEANVIDIINACSHIHKYDCLPNIVISALTLNAIPRSHPEELNNITLADRLNRLESQMSCMQITLDKLIAENLTLKDKVYISTSYASKVSSGTTKVGVTSASHGATTHSQSQGKKASQDMQPKLMPAANLNNSSSNKYNSLIPPNVNPSMGEDYSDKIEETFIIPKQHLKQMRRKEHRQAIIGKASNDSQLKGAPEPGRDLFVFRHDPKTAAEDVQSYIEDQQITVYDIKQMSHDDSQYKSYKVTVPVSKGNELLKAETWPVRWFRNTKNRDGNT